MGKVIEYPSDEELIRVYNENGQNATGTARILGFAGRTFRKRIARILGQNRKDYSYLVGEKYNELKILNVLPITHGERLKVECLCDCGNVVTKTFKQVKNNHVKTCGHYKKSCFKNGGKYRRRSSPEEVLFNSLFRSYKYSARDRAVEFHLTETQFKVLIEQNCHYCGAPPQQIVKVHYLNETLTYTGVDRMINSLGYINENCVPCCKVCNRGKSNMDYCDFINYITRIKEHPLPLVIAPTKE